MSCSSLRSASIIRETDREDMGNSKTNIATLDQNGTRLQVVHYENGIMPTASDEHQGTNSKGQSSSIPRLLSGRSSIGGWPQCHNICGMPIVEQTPRKRSSSSQSD